jgi:hypothetical protein
VVFPIVRRVFSKLLANDIVSVQAMNLPIGKLFYFIPKIQDRTTDGSNSHYSPYGMPGNSGASDQGYTGQRSLYDRFYETSDGNSPETGLFDYSKGQFSGVTLSGATVVTFADGAVTNVTNASLTGTSVSNLILKFTGFTKDGQGKLIGPNGSVMDTEDFLASTEIYYAGVSRNFNIVTQKYGKGIVEYGQKATATSYPSGKYNDICDEEGTIYVNVDLQSYSSTSGFSNMTLPSGFTAAGVTMTFRVYDTLEFEDQIGEVSFDLQSVTVSVTERKLRC